MNSKSKQKIVFNQNLSGIGNSNNSNDSFFNVSNQESNTTLGKTNIPIDNISDILNENNSLREKLLKQIVDIYKNNPDKLLNDLGPSDFAKVSFLINLINNNP